MSIIDYIIVLIEIDKSSTPIVLELNVYCSRAHNIVKRAWILMKFLDI